MKKLILSLLGVALFIVLVGLLTQANRGQQNILSGLLNINRTSSPFADSDLKTIKVGNPPAGDELRVFPAKTEDQKRKGLSGITNLPENEGMIFDYKNSNARPAFWMKDMKIAIDIIWIKANKIIQIDSAAVQPGVADTDLKLYMPYQTVDYVLEVNSGWSGRNNVKVGDLVDLGSI